MWFVIEFIILTKHYAKKIKNTHIRLYLYTEPHNSSDHADLVTDLIAASDNALYTAKIEGRNCVRIA